MSKKEKKREKKTAFVVKDGYSGVYEPLYVCTKFKYLKKWIINRYKNFSWDDDVEIIKNIEDGDEDELIKKCEETSKYRIERVDFN